MSQIGVSVSDCCCWHRCLAFLRSIFLHAFDARLPKVCLHAPGQILPRANTATVTDRMRKWACWSSVGASQFLGGTELEVAFTSVPLRVHVMITDALTANNAMNALEEVAFGCLQREQWRPQAQYHARLTQFCVHHQAALAKRPALLSIPALCSGLVRMCALPANHQHFGVAASLVIPLRLAHVQL